MNLQASGFKRAFKIKDFGDIIPGKLIVNVCYKYHFSNLQKTKSNF